MHFIVLLVIFVSSAATARPCGPRALDSIRETASALTNGAGENDQWRGVGSLVVNGMHCTVTLIEPPGACAFDENQEALVLTSGHCLGVDSKVRRSEAIDGNVTFNYFTDTRQSQVPARTTSVVYSSMNGRDVALVRLDKKYRELASSGIRPRKVSRGPAAGTLLNTSIPVIGISEPYARQSSCKRSRDTAVIESGYLWERQFAIACPVHGGSSGSSLVDGRGEVAGVVNTTNVSAGAPHATCSMNHPCEITDAPPQSAPTRTTYAFDTAFLHSCFTRSCEFDPSARGCAMPAETPPEAQMIFDQGGARLSVESGTSQELVRVKVGRIGQLDCSDPSGYVEARSGQKFLQSAPEGAYGYCILGKRADGTWQAPNAVVPRGLIVDRTAPTITGTRKAAFGYLPVVSPAGDSSYFNFKYTSDPSECASAQGYRRPNPLEAARGVRKPASGESHLCFKAFDQYGNGAAGFGFRIP